MLEYRADRDTALDGRMKSGAGGTIAILVVVFAFFMGVLFAYGFWSVDVKDRGLLPHVKVSATGGHLPHVSVKLKEVVVETEKTTVEAPTVAIKEN